MEIYKKIEQKIIFGKNYTNILQFGMPIF